ncbi:laminin subunit gamma-1 [Neodiprion fabricii]|uniref:laminin subunit gamma-1 n=1 Tax=Neodiprion fabricii TaxID=2872261 RepID=UPI001ED8CA64|nr:laminin subunit gamma-1 [Neodiprion fabricii]XP_046413040.1 laminin subunit gamma-1 [Neodiprion fabricii]XP_046413041.1 laminin subunit gamma-1 [Neodiprion fabricii]XP_046413043.1 laminin subunit gamma-1 [Neodiprion fabricii]XP_046413044.1 laminin subunit gamma-1 [Neodiprion fabricii]
MSGTMWNSLLLIAAVSSSVVTVLAEFDQIPITRRDDKCYNETTGRAQRCIPSFLNAAFSVPMEATNTCGENGIPTEYCKQTGVQQKSCDFCHAGDHPASYLTDLGNNDNATWWQSETMYEAVQYPNQVNLTLHLDKTYDITYVRILFISPRPESLGIYKRKNENSPWQPYQFYSATCRDTYGLPDSKETVRGDDTRVLCSSEYSDISPLTGGNVAFSTLEGRPSAYWFETNPELQEWVQASDLRITLDRLNTFGDEVFGDDQVLKSYYYAIAEVAVGARCTCNGHAGECVQSTGIDGSTRRVCRCEHNTAGADCNECLPFYNDAPWARATSFNAYECKACNCNGYSDRCYFDNELYKATGHGGHCLDCSLNRDGANCERCRENFYERAEDGYCFPCNCHETGSRSLQCNSEGKCQCKPGVTGDKCDRCAPNFYNFGSLGCTSCECNIAGSLGNVETCDPYNGDCQCKENVEGKRCRECRPGFFNLAVSNVFGCTPCFCYGHSSVCESESGYSKVVIESMFARGTERWSAEVNGRRLPLNYDSLTQSISVAAQDREDVYFVAPDRFLGDQRASYNQDMTFKLRIGDRGAAPTVSDVILEGRNGQPIAQPIFGQNNPSPSGVFMEYRFRLHEHPDYGWLPQLSSRDFMSILSNLTAIKIRGTYTHKGRGFLDDVMLETAHRGAAGEPADWIEHCTCPHGYIGQFCESCSPGFHHEPSNGGPFALCVPCNCNGHAEICEAETGQCICQHHTSGDNCQHCQRGYYGYPLKGTPDDCKPCPCPDQGHCILLDNNADPICSECPLGRTGARCEVCSDGYFGDPENNQKCRPCECNNNIDLNAVRNCNQLTGECLKCVNNTAGFNCEECLPGYYGDALSDRKEDGCVACQCYAPGTQELDDGSIAPCDQLTGYCRCKPHVTGRNCDKCEDGYYNIASGEGCAACNCDPEGSHDRTCDALTGQCQCKPGVTSQRCDACLPYQYGFGNEGCKRCDCDEIGSQELQCGPDGQCPCLQNVEGRRCDRCKENKHDRQRGCIDCPPCYNLVQDAINAHRRRLDDLEDTLRKIGGSQTAFKKDTDFEKDLKNVQDRVRTLLQNAQQNSGSNKKSLVEQLDELRNLLNEIDYNSQEVDSIADGANETATNGQMSIEEAETVLDTIHEQLSEAEGYLATEGRTALEDARKRAEEVGQQNNQMTAIAQKARELADINTNEAKKVYDIANNAKNRTLQAYNLAKQAMYKNTNISDEIRALDNELQLLKDKFNKVKDLTKITANKSAAVLKEALVISIVNLIIPTIDIDELQRQADAISNEGLMIKERAQLLLEDNDDLLREISEKILNSEKLLERARDQQDTIGELFLEADDANAKVDEAVKRGDHTLKEAQETHKKLSEFDEEVRREQLIAQESLRDIDEIRKLIDDAFEKTRSADQTLNGAEVNAVKARNIAKEAQENYANKASENANRIRMEANRTKSKAISLSQESEHLQTRLKFTESRIKEQEEQAARDANVTSEAKQKVGQSKTNVGVASQQVDKALLEVAEIIKELEALPEINEADLDRLEERLNAAEQEIKANNLDERIRALTVAKNLQIQWVKNYDEEVARLKLEVENIETIKLALPTDCFKRVRLEP